MRIGILGGTFNPIHIAHLILAEEALVRAKLDEVIFVPSRIPPHKSPIDMITPELRAAMVSLAIQDNQRFRMSSMELSRPGPSYTLDTLIGLQPRDTIEHDLFFITGLDTFQDLKTWYHYQEVLTLTNFIIASRPSSGLESLLTLEFLKSREREEGAERALSERVFTLLYHAEPNHSNAIYFLHIPDMDISSRDIRARINQELPFRYLLPPAVYSYIQTHKLYRTKR